MCAVMDTNKIYEQTLSARWGREKADELKMQATYLQISQAYVWLCWIFIKVIALDT